MAFGKKMKFFSYFYAVVCLTDVILCRLREVDCTLRIISWVGLYIIILVIRRTLFED